MLREYLTTMTERSSRDGGTLDKFIGDAVMAIFGAPVALSRPRPARLPRGPGDDRRRSTSCTPSGWRRAREPFRIGIGINTGDMVVGNLGSEQLFDYTVIGDGVNLGARLESLNKEYQTTAAHHHQREHLRGREATRSRCGRSARCR